ncbi:transcription factor bHLH62 [Gossypium raimondii]|uniref:BHLH domain-containing protein n=2 Tax=Gossypium raimondii TaxID=29730 RepID=A0A0D2ND15_GOSRA|nr:transcription factor bHLH62 [Gossypium raimondii]KJB10873.1 hypothetical protein B456_001G230000 [Gossypium raimondii]
MDNQFSLNAPPFHLEPSLSASYYLSSAMDIHATELNCSQHCEQPTDYYGLHFHLPLSSMPSQVGGFQGNNNNISPLQGRSKSVTSQNESLLNPNADLEASKYWNSRKRTKTVETSASPTIAAKGSERNQESNEKRSNTNTNTKPLEPPKDYIHVRARRGEATDSHSLAERVRREKISERMKLLQDLVPGCNKVIGKAVMLDEIIKYVQSLQRQVEFLSMKLASVNSRLDFKLDSVMSEDIFQSNNNFAHPISTIDSWASAIFGQQQQNLALHSNVSNGTMTQCSVQPMDTAIWPQLQHPFTSNQLPLS